MIAAYYKIPTKTETEILNELSDPSVDVLDMLARLLNEVGLVTKALKNQAISRLWRMPLPALIVVKENRCMYLMHRDKSKNVFVICDPVTRKVTHVAAFDLISIWNGTLILAKRRVRGPGIAPQQIGIKWFAPTLLKYKSSIVHALIASIIIQAFAIITPLFFQLIIDKVLVHKSIDTLYVLIIGLAAVNLFDVTMQYLRTYVFSHTGSRIDAELGYRLFQHIMGLPISYFETRSVGHTTSRVRELETIRQFLTGQGVSCAIDVAFTFVLLAVLFLYSIKLAVIVILITPLYVVVTAIIRPILRQKTLDKFSSYSKSQQFLVETVMGIQTVKSLSAETMMQKDWNDLLASHISRSFDTTKLSALNYSLIQCNAKITTAMILCFGSQEVMAGAMTVGALVAFNMISNQISQPVLRLSQLWQDCQQFAISLERISEILRFPTEPKTSTHNISSKKKVDGAINFVGIKFRYGRNESYVLSDISLDIPAGQTIGIVGPSGSGKSTLTKLLQKLYVPEVGKIYLDGVDLSDIDPRWLRQHIGVVLQENVLFNRSIHDNIAFSNPSLPRDRIVDVSKLAGADEFITKLSDGYDTIIEERGANLSGGQRQRIAIARALAPDPRVLILDEATSALDYESERIIQISMRKISIGRTVIIISHRLVAVQDCDRIISIQAGNIVEDGTHDELLRAGNGPYAHFWQLQMRAVTNISE